MSPDVHYTYCTRRAFSLVELLFVIAIISLLAALLFPTFSQAREKARSVSCASKMKQMGLALQLYLQDYDETYPMNRLPDADHSMQGCTLSGISTYPLSNLEESRINWRRVIQPYLNSKQVQICPSNPYAERAAVPGVVPGDQTNHYYRPGEYLPLSYAYNGNFFHEAIPPCLYGEKLERPRKLSEIDNSSNLILLVESRSPTPDLGNWAIHWQVDAAGNGMFQSHNTFCNFLFTDLHVKSLKFAHTCDAKMWSDHFPAGEDSCQGLEELFAEYR